MRAFIRISFGAALAVSLGFIWTVGQSGLAQTNQHLCELWAKLPLPPYHSCEFQYVLVYIWGAAAFIGILWIIIEIIWARKTIGRALRMIEPHHVIIVGLVIALAGVVWLWRNPPGNSHLAAIKSQLDTVQKQLSDIREPKAEPASHPVTLPVPQNPYLKDVFIYAGQDLGKDAAPLNPRFVAKFARNGPRARFYVEDRYYPLGVWGATAWMRTPQIQLGEYKDFVANDPIDFPILTPFDHDGNKFWRWGPPTDKVDGRTTFQNHADHQGRVILIIDGEPPAYFYFIVNPGPPQTLPDIVGQWRFDFAAKWEAEDAAQK
jgi:hypothetical protein